MPRCFFSKKNTPSIPVASNQYKNRDIGWDGLPIGTRKLSFHIDTGATFGPDKIPLVYGSLNNPAEVIAAVTFDTDEDCTGEIVDVDFYATAYVRVNGTTSISLVALYQCLNASFCFILHTFFCTSRET